MNPDLTERALRDLSLRMREADAADAPAFARVWQQATVAAEGSRRSRSPRLLLPLAFLVIGALLVTTLVTRRGAERRAKEQALAEAQLITVEGALLTYWEAPTDVLLDPVWSSAPRQIH